MKRAFLLFALAAFFLASCGDNGSWEPIKMTENMLEVPAAGGIVTTRVLNYPIVTLIGLYRDGVEVTPISTDPMDVNDPYRLQTEYLEAVCKDRIITITVYNTRDTVAHTFELETRNENAFYTVVIKQAAYAGE